MQACQQAEVFKSGSYYCCWLVLHDQKNARRHIAFETKLQMLQSILMIWLQIGFDIMLMGANRPDRPWPSGIHSAQVAPQIQQVALAIENAPTIRDGAVICCQIEFGRMNADAALSVYPWIPLQSPFRPSVNLDVPASRPTSRSRTPRLDVGQPSCPLT